MTMPRLAALLLLALGVTSAGAQVKTYKDIKYPELAPFTIPKPEVVTLKNGMTVFLMEDHELPLISATARIRTGSNYEPAAKVGLASIMADVQRTGGTTSMPGEKMDEFLALRAAAIETGMGSESGTAGMSCLKENFDEVFALFADVLRKPAFPQDKLDLAKVQANTGIARRNDDVNSITSREFARLIYGPDSPLARLEEYATIAAITREDLVSWHRSYYHPNNVLLGIVGDFRSADMKKTVEKVFGAWPAGPKLQLPEVTLRREPRAGIFFIEKSDVNQANVQIGHLGMLVTDPDYFPVQVMNEVLGGSFASRLFSNVRSRKGLAYSVYGGVGSGFLHPGIFRTGLQTKSATTVEGIEALREEIRGIIENPPSDAELARAKESILNSFIFNYDSKGEILSQQLLYAYYGLPADFLERYRANIEKVTREDVARVAKKFVHPDQLTVLVVGKASDFGRPLSTLGPSETIDITIPAPPDTTPKVERTEASAADGARILDRALALLARGGPITSMRATSTNVVEIGGQKLQLQQEQAVVFPDRIRSVTKTPMGDQTVIVSGGRGVQMGPMGRQEMSAEQLAEVNEQLARNLPFLASRRAEVTAVAAGSDQVGGTACDVVSVELRGVETRLCVAADGRVLRQSFQGSNPITGAPGRIEVTFSDFRDVAGRPMAHTSVTSIDGQTVVTETMQTLEINPAIEPTTFEIPQG